MPIQANALTTNQRRAGVLLHISSLPSAYYTGDLGAEAYQFVDFLQEIGASVWQTLPINMPHADNSPYQCLSAHAGNHLHKVSVRSCWVALRRMAVYTYQRLIHNLLMQI